MPRETFEFREEGTIGLKIEEERKTREALIEEKIEKAKETKKPQEIITEFPGGKIKEGISPEKLAPGFKPIVTKELIFETKSGKPLSFYNEVPRRVYLIRGLYNAGKLEREAEREEIESRFEYNPYYDKKQERWEGIIEYGDLTKPGNTLSFLHEIGHSKSIYLPKRRKIEENIDKLETKLLLYDAKRKGKYDPQVAQMEREREKKYLPKKDEVETKVWSTEEEKMVSVIISKKDFIKYVKLKANDERYAWNVALRVLRKYKKEGIDLEPKLSQEDIERTVHGLDNLGGYERDYIESLEDEKLRKELKGTFSLKYYFLKEKDEL